MDQFSGDDFILVEWIQAKEKAYYILGHILCILKISYFFEFPSWRSFLVRYMVIYVKVIYL